MEEVVARKSEARRVRIYDIARHAGVSATTVSAMLTGNRPVSPATRTRVERSIATLGYRANASAKALVRGRTDSIALLIPPAGRSLSVFEVDFIARVVQQARASDYDVLVSTSLEQEKVFARLVEEERVDGVILLEICLEDHRVERLVESGMPFVAVGRTADPGSISWVDIDFAGLVRDFVRYLCDLGHDDLVLVNTPRPLYDRGYGPAHRAQSGFLEACGELGLRGRVVYCDSNPEAGFRVMSEILAEDSSFTGLVVTNDYAVGGIYQALTLEGRRIPRDTSIISVTDARWAEAFSPRLTAAPPPVEEMAVAAVRILTAKLADPALPPVQHLILPPVTLRESTAAAPVRLSSRVLDRLQ
jgi:DNA-binding LacI/PurR family transcriptional regulator